MLPLGDGQSSPQVVLPDGKDSARDVVVFLDAAHAAGSEEEAAQRGAVAALQRVAGERSLHRVLPPAYRDLWQALGVQVCGVRLVTPFLPSKIT